MFPYSPRAEQGRCTRYCPEFSLSSPLVPRFHVPLQCQARQLLSRSLPLLGQGLTPGMCKGYNRTQTAYTGHFRTWGMHSLLKNVSVKPLALFPPFITYILLPHLFSVSLSVNPRPASPPGKLHASPHGCAAQLHSSPRADTVTAVSSLRQPLPN